MADTSFKPQPAAITGYLLAVAATVIWSGNFIIARGLSQHIPPVGLTFWRWFIAVLVFVPFAIRPVIADRALIKKHFTYLSVTAFIGVTLFNVLMYVAGRTTTAINLSLIAISSPIFIVIFARILFGESITLKKVAGILLAVSGVILLITGGSLSKLTNLTFAIGDVWMFFAASAFALYSVLVKKKPAAMHLYTFLFSTFTLGIIYILPFYIWEHFCYKAVTVDSSTILAVLYSGVLGSLAAFFMWNKAILIVGPSKSALIYYMIPVFTGIAAYLFLDEKFRIISLLSMALIVCGILTANYVGKLKG
jgi:drug/metabolite transporter (DMT)-like permease